MSQWVVSDDSSDMTYFQFIKHSKVNQHFSEAEPNLQFLSEAPFLSEDTNPKS